MKRRNFLRGALLGAGGTVLGLPYLESLPYVRGVPGLTTRVAKAQGDAPPLRLLVVMSPQGLLQDRWIPSGTGGLNLPSVFSPLAAHRDDLLVVSGIDNAVRWQVEPVGGGGHHPAGRTLFSAWPYAEVMNGDGTVPSTGELVARGFSDRDVTGAPWGASIDQVVAQQIGASDPIPSLSLRIGSEYAHENELFFAGRDGAVTAVGGEHRPARAYSSLTRLVPDDGGGPPPPEPPVPDLATRLRNRRSTVLGAVASQFRRLESQVGREDRARLEAHATFVDDLERRSRVMMEPGGGGPGGGSMGCQVHEQSFPGGYNPATSDWDNVTAPAQMDNAVLALACGLTRVATVQFTDYHGPSFPFLGSSIPGGWANWHEMVHGDAGSDLATRESVFRFYAEQMAYLLDRLASIDEGGTRLLDNTVVLWMSEFGDAAAHWTGDIPVVLAGGGLRTGRHERFARRTTNDVFSTIKQIFGFEDTRFGLQRGGDGSNLNRGPLEGLI